MRSLLLVAALALPLAPAYAGQAPHHAKHAHHAAAKLPKSLKKNPAVKAYVDSMHTMHKGMNITYTGDADIDFARGMVPHHQGAVDMIAVLRKHGKDAELLALAETMAKWQNVEIAQMNRWLETRDNANLPKADCKDPVVVAYKQTMDDMHKAMDIRYTGDADVDFVNGMIPHHQGAIDMAQVLLEHGRDPQLRKIGNDVVRSQQQEIAWMKNWLEKRGK